MDSKAITLRTDAFGISQAVYHAITGKTETQSRVYMGGYVVQMADICRLADKVEQTVHQWQLFSKNENVTIYHVDDASEVSSSFERFRIYDSSRTSPVECVVCKFNFMLGKKVSDGKQTLEDEQAQDCVVGEPYTVTVRIISRVAAFKRMRDQMAPSAILRYFQNAAITVECQYVNYMVVRSVMHNIDSWVKELDNEELPKLVQWIQPHSEWIPQILRPLFMILSTIAFYYAAPSVLPTMSPPALLAQFLLLAIVVTLLLASVGLTAGRVIENALDSLFSGSVIKMNKGDEKLIKEESKGLRKCYSLIGITWLWATTVAIGSKVGISWLSKWLIKI